MFLRTVSQVRSHEMFRTDMKVLAQNFELKDVSFLSMHFDSKYEDEQPGQGHEKPWA